jgi:Tfp pilus assembly protein PilO
MKIRALTKSEKTLFALCICVVVLVVAFFAWRDHRARTIAAQQKIENLQSRFTAAVAASADAPFWKERQAWLDATMPVMGDSGQAHSAFLEYLQTTANQRGLRLTSPVLLKTEAGPHHRELPISLQISGADNALFRWLAELQSPEKFQMVKYVLLTPAATSRPRMTASVTVSRLYKP